MRFRGAMLLAILICATSAHAQKQEAPCAADAKKLCSGVSPGEGRMLACLREHESKLSASCKAIIAHATPVAARPATGKRHTACEADVAKLCKDVPVGQGRVLQCLKSHADQLTPECKASLEARAQKLATTPAIAAVASPAPTAKKK